MKIPATWSSNPSNEANEYPYDSLVYMFDSATQNYDGVVDNDLKDRDFLPADWSNTTKPASNWASDTSDLHPYDSASDAYDSANTAYDGTVDTNRKFPTRWSLA